MIRLGIDRSRHCAMVQYDSTDSAKDALNSLKGSFIGNSKRLMVCYYYSQRICNQMAVGYGND